MVSIKIWYKQDLLHTFWLKRLYKTLQINTKHIMYEEYINKKVIITFKNISNYSVTGKVISFDSYNNVVLDDDTVIRGSNIENIEYVWTDCISVIRKKVIIKSKWTLPNIIDRRDTPMAIHTHSRSSLFFLHIYVISVAKFYD